MFLTQEAILSLLIAEGGKVKKSDLVDKFKDSMDCVDPAEKERKRDLFKTFVNNVAFVKEIDGARYVVLKKTYHHLLGGDRREGRLEEMSENEEIPHAGEQQRPPARRKKTESFSEDAGPEISGGPHPEEDSESRDSPADLLSPFQLALQRTKYTDVRVKRMLNFDTHKQDTGVNYSSVPSTAQSKPYALPLRMPPSTTRVEKLKVNPEEPPKSPNLDPLRSRRRTSSIESSSSNGSPQLGRSVKSTKASDEPRDTRIPSMFPLEQAEHEWLVKCAAGHWSQVYGLLLRDVQLAEKRDFMSGFTALHWAAKCGNSEMLVKIIDVSKQGGIDVDINVKTHGGYTPLHIAALHDQGYIITMLVNEYSADINVRDNCGKKPYHYLHKDMSGSVREMLGEPPKAPQVQDRVPHEKEELDMFPDLSKGLHSISRLFQPNVTGLKKKHKQRLGLYSLSEDPIEDRDDNGFRPRLSSDAFM